MLRFNGALTIVETEEMVEVVFITSLIRKIHPVPYTSSVRECLSAMVDATIDFACLADQNGNYLGSIQIYDLIGCDPTSSVSDVHCPTTKFPEVSLQTPPPELLMLVNSHNTDYLVVIDHARKYLGVLNVRELLARELSQKYIEQAEKNKVLETLGYGYILVSREGLIHGSSLAYQMLNVDCNNSLSVADLPGSDYIGDALTKGACYADLEINYDGRHLLMNILPVADKPGLVMVILGDTNRIRHFIVLQTIFGSMREGVNIVDECGVLNYCNPSSARYVNATPEEMIGQSITKYYPKAVLLGVLKNHQPYSDERLFFDGRIFVVNAVPLFIDGIFKGGIAIFREITEIIQLTTKMASMEEQINTMQVELNMSKHADVFDVLVGSDGSLKKIVEKASRCIAALGGPRHCIITGETGTGKTTLAKSMYYFAKKIQVINSDAPFIEVNCAQFTNPDIAAVEIFGSEKGSFTGALDRKGIIEIADGGILFLDEAHALGPYQTMLLKVIEEGMLRRIGGRVDKKLAIILIAASSQNLRDVLLPELYQRLAQYQILLTPLRLRPNDEKKAMLHNFCRLYEQSAKSHYGVNLKLTITSRAEHLLMSAYYPRNIRQFRDVVNSSIDAAVPLVFTARDQVGPVVGVVDTQHLPQDLFETAQRSVTKLSQEESEEQDNFTIRRIADLHQQGLGPRKIAKILKAEGISIEYYQVAYRLKNLK